jgi:hypothetical protein
VYRYNPVNGTKVTPNVRIQETIRATRAPCYEQDRRIGRQKRDRSDSDEIPGLDSDSDSTFAPLKMDFA